MSLSGACYIRVSTDDQTEFSPDAQRKAIEKYAKNNDIVLLSGYVYIDEGISGKKAEKRPAFLRMIAAARTKPRPFDVILVHKFDRFARSREDSVVYKSLLKKEAGIRVISITETLEDDKFSIILEAMLEAMAEYYSLNLSDEVKKGMTEKALRGGFQTAPPFGYTVRDGGLIVCEKEAEFVRVLFERFACGEHTLLSLARYAESIGIKTKRGKLFENRSIAYILSNPVYIGKVRWTPSGKCGRGVKCDETIIADSTHPPIVAQDLWDAVQKRLYEQKQLYPKTGNRTAQARSWLSGLVKCSSCGRTLVVSNQRYFQCNGYAKGSCKESHAVKISAIEELVLAQLAKDFTGEIRVAPLAVKSDVESAQSTEYLLLAEQRRRVEKRLIRAREAYFGGADSLEEYIAEKSALEQQRAEIGVCLRQIDLQTRHSKISLPSARTFQSINAVLTDETVELGVKYKATHFLIQSIVYDKGGETLHITYRL